MAEVYPSHNNLSTPVGAKILQTANLGGKAMTAPQVGAASEPF
jgi:hypothetical protein